MTLLKDRPMLHRLALAGLLLCLVTGLLVPIYTDEINWRLHMRAAIDGGIDIAASDLCGPNTYARAPWLMMPVRWFSATLNQAFAAPLYVRLSGVGCALLFAALAWVTTSLMTPDRNRRAKVQALVFALLGLGFLPFLLVLSRAEQPIILCVGLMILTTFIVQGRPQRQPLAICAASVIVILAAVAVSYHLKGVLYLPVALGCLWLVTKGRSLLPVRLAGLAAVLSVGAVAIPYWVGRFKCTGDPVLAATLARENVAASLAGKGQLGDLLGQLADGANPLAYPLLTVPRPAPMSTWMPEELFSPALSTAFAVVISALWLAALTLAVVGMIRFVWSERSRALTEPRFLLALIILGCVFVWGCSQVNRNDYEASHVLPMLAMFLALALTLPGSESKLLRPLVLVAVPLALLSQLVVLALTVGPLWQIAHQPGYIERQKNSLSIAGYAQIRRDIHAAMAEAGFPTDRRLRRVLVDDLTYLDLQGSYMPLHRVGVLSDFNGSIENPAEYLVSRDSDGIVIGCKYLPPELSQARSGQICAISREGLEEAAAVEALTGILTF